MMTSRITQSTFDQPLLRTKISPPEIPGKSIHRLRLTEKVEQGIQGPLTLISAPAGFGKTHLLVEWLKEENLTVAWISLDRMDNNDQDRLFWYLITALQTLEPHLGEETLDFMQSSKASGEITSAAVQIGLTQLMNEISLLPKDLVLIMDDFQSIEDQDKLQNISYFLKKLPSNLHLVIASRSEPALDLAYLRAKGRVVEIGADDLRFTGDEIELFFKQAMGVNLLSETLQSLEQRTNGWVTALQMAALSLGNHPDPNTQLANLKGDIHYLVDFLAEEVLNQQPEEVQQFLLKSSILDTLTGPLCDAVVYPELEPGNGTMMLIQLERSNLFITFLNGNHSCFRFHSLFADFLRQIHARKNPTEIPVLQKRAALWFEQNGDLENAIPYALASGDTEWAADFIERNIETLIQTGEVFSLPQWTELLPEAVIHQRPLLSLAIAWALIASYRLDLARYWLDDVRGRLTELERLSKTEPPSDEKKTSLWNIHAGLAICHSTLALLSGDLEQAAEFSRQAIQYLQEKNPFYQSLLALDESLYFLLSGDTVKASESLRNTIRIARQANNLLVMIVASCQLADTQAMQGKLSQALVTLQKAQLMASGPNGQRLSLASIIDIEMGELLLKRNSLEEANTYLERGMETSGNMWMLSNLDGMSLLAQLRQVQGDVSGAQAAIEEAMRMALNTESSDWDKAYVCAVAVRLALQRGDFSTAEQWWIRGGFPELRATIDQENYPYQTHEYLLLTQARFLLIKGCATRNKIDLQRAAELLENMLPVVEQYHRVTSQIEILIFLAMIQFSFGDDRSKQTMLRALALGEPEGYERIYLDEGRGIIDLLRQCRSEQQASANYLPSLAFIDRLFEAIQPVENDRRPDQKPIEQRKSPVTARLEDGFPISLSAREMEVLKLIAAGKSNDEISDELYLTLNTVKRHAYNIYSKLEVSKRTQAVMKARQLALIS